MTDLQKHMMQLVQEIDTVCNENNLSYVLFGRTAGHANDKKKFTTGCCRFQIMMAAKDVPKLKALLLKKGIDNRAVVDMSNNAKLAWNRMYYIDTATTLFDKTDPVEYGSYGVAVTIIPAYSQEPGNRQKKLEYGFGYLHGAGVLVENKATQEQLGSVQSVSRLMKIFGEKRITGHLYKMLGKDAKSPKGKSLYVQDAIGKYIKIEKDVLLKTKKIVFEGMELPVSEKPDNFFKALYGKNWKKTAVEPLPTSNRMEVICDADVPYTVYMDLFQEENLDIDNLYSREREYRKWMANTWQTWKDKSDKTLLFGKRSIDRIDLFLHYEKCMDQLEEASKNNWDEFVELMNPYIKCVNKYKKRGMGFYINESLHQYSEMIWAKTKGKENFGKEVLEMTPALYKEKDMKEYLEPYR